MISSSGLIIIMVGVQSLLILFMLGVYYWLADEHLHTIIENQETIIKFLNGTGQL